MIVKIERFIKWKKDGVSMVSKLKIRVLQNYPGIRAEAQSVGMYRASQMYDELSSLTSDFFTEDGLTFVPYGIRVGGSTGRIQFPFNTRVKEYRHQVFDKNQMEVDGRTQNFKKKDGSEPLHTIVGVLYDGAKPRSRPVNPDEDYLITPGEDHFEKFRVFFYPTRIAHTTPIEMRDKFYQFVSKKK